MNNKGDTVSQQEVEVRAILQSEQRDLLVNKLDSEYSNITKEELIDIYYCPQNATSFQDIEMNRIGSYSLRLRSKKSGVTSKVDMNVKVITTEGDHNAWSEHEIAISSLEGGKAILNAIGFKQYFIINKKRRTYTLKKDTQMITVIIEDIQDFGPIIEIEIMSTKSEVDEAKKQIYNFLQSLGISDEQIVKKSITNLLMNKLASF